MGNKSANTPSETNRVAGGYRVVYNVAKKMLESDVCPMLWGPPGVGKSTMAKGLADEFKVPLMTIILSHQADPADIVGGKIPGFLDGPDGKKIPVLHDCVPGWFEPFLTANKPFLLFLDEIPNSPAHATTILNSILLDRKIGNFPLPKGTMVMTAGNRMEDQCMVYPLSAALQQRIAHMEVRADVTDFSIYAKQAGLEPQISAYVNWKGIEGLISNVGTYPRVCPRVWEMADRVLKHLTPADSKNLVNYLGAVVGIKTAMEMKTFLEVWQNIDLTAIYAGKPPDFDKVSEDVKFAISFGLANDVNRKYKNPKERKTVDWALIANTLLANKFPPSLATLFFLNLDDTPIREASAEQKYAPFVDKVVKLLTSV